jgi:hypothetical protein
LTKVSIVLNLVFINILIGHISNILTTIKIITHVITFIVHGATIILDNWLPELEFVLQAYATEFLQDSDNSITMT